MSKDRGRAIGTGHQIQCTSRGKWKCYERSGGIECDARVRVQELQNANSQVMQGQATAGTQATGRESPEPLICEQFNRLAQKMGETGGSIRDLSGKSHPN